MVPGKSDIDTMSLKVFIAAAGAFSFVFFLLQLKGFYHDDAYIFLRYVQNLLEGNGVVWNPGERVEGYTSFLWIVLIAVTSCLKIDLVSATKLLGVLFGVLTMAACFLYEKDRPPLAALLLATSSSFVLWSTGGLETVVFTFFVVAGYWCSERDAQSGRGLFATGVVFSIAALLRWEGMLVFGLTLLFCFFKGRQGTRLRLGRTLLLASGFLAVYLPYFVWRLSYYGYLFPCPVYVKGGAGILKLLFGVRYVFHFFVYCGFPLLLLLLVRDWKTFFARRLYLISLVVCYSIYIMVMGGDHMPGFRFFVPVLPLMYLLAQHALRESRLNRGPFLYGAAFILIAALNVTVSLQSIPRGPEQTREAMRHSYRYVNCFKVPDPAAYIGMLVGRYIKEQWPADALVAGNIAGSIPYYSGLRFVDMLGLNDYTIARRDTAPVYNALFREWSDVKNLFTGRGRAQLKQGISTRYLPWQLMPGHGMGDGQYVLSRRPDYIIIGPAEGDTRPWFLSDKELLASPEFQARYMLREVTISADDALHAYYTPTAAGALRFRYYERTPQAAGKGDALR